jgi:hypothetical protein
MICKLINITIWDQLHEAKSFLKQSQSLNKELPAFYGTLRAHYHVHKNALLHSILHTSTLINQ